MSFEQFCWKCHPFLSQSLGIIEPKCTTYRHIQATCAERRRKGGIKECIQVPNVNNAGNEFATINFDGKNKQIKKTMERSSKESHVYFHISSHFHFLSSRLSCHAGVLLIVPALKKPTTKIIKQIERMENSTRGRSASMCLLFFSKGAQLRHTYVNTHTNTYWDASHRLINTEHFSGISRVFIVRYNRHIRTQHTSSHYSHTNIHKQSLAWISFGKLSVLLSHASWNFARASRSFAISHLCKPWDRPIWIIQLIH